MKLVVLALFAAGGAAVMLTDNSVNRRAYARSTGPDPGHTRAPGEDPEACSVCHLPDGAPSGSITIGAPQSYVPGQTYQITVSETNNHPSRRRWGFQLTAVDDDGNRAGTLQPLDGLTQVLTGTLGTPARQYIEHTAAGTFQGQPNGANWTFNWTAPASDVGPVTFYTAGNQANNDGNTSGDSINFTFVTVAPAAQAADFSVTIAPAAQLITPGASGTYAVTVTPANGFNGAVSLSLAGLPAGVSGSFNPTSISITDASPRSSTLTVTNNSNAPLGSFTFTVTAAGAGLTRSAAATVVTGPSLTDSGLQVRAVVRGLNQPITMAFIADNDLFVLEKATGRVRRVTNGAVQAAPALDLNVNSASERGLLGIALHPSFPANPRVYLYWTESSTGADSSNTGDTPLLGNRVDSYLWDGSTLTHERNLIRLRAFQQDAGQGLAGNHNGGIIRFGPDGKLYIIVGDVGRRGLMQNLTFGPSVSPQGPTVADDQFGGPEPDDAHLTGVVLRLNDDGTTPPDNPFYNVQTGLTGEAAVNVKKVFAYGIRNSFGMAFDPVAGQLWTQENGDDSYDEINRVQPGFNGGWVQLMGPSARVLDYKTIELSRGGGLQQQRWPPDRLADTPQAALARLFNLPGALYTEPAFSWRYAVAPSALGFVRGRALGPQYEGDMILGASRTTLLGGYLFRFKLASGRNALAVSDARLNDMVADNADKFDPTESETLIFGRDFGVTTDIQTAPAGGRLYVVSLSHGALYEVSAKQSTIQFGAANFRADEGSGKAVITVTRAGDTSISSSVFYTTAAGATDKECNEASGGVASERCDFITTLGTINFAPGQTEAQFTVPLTDDAHVEGPEAVTVTLSNAAGAALGSPSAATLTIGDNDATATTANPIDTFEFFVRQQYLDFLAREPDADGFAYWLKRLTDCRDTPGCDMVRTRIEVSGGFYYSREFYRKGYFAYRFYRASLGREPKYVEFMPDMARLQGLNEAEEEARRAEFTAAWVTRPEFQQKYSGLNDTDFVNKLADASGVSLDRQQLQAMLQNGKTKADVVRAVVESQAVSDRYFQEAVVTILYFGYLRRDYDEDGFQYWLRRLNPSDLGPVVGGFLYSREYQRRFGNVNY